MKKFYSPLVLIALFAIIGSANAQLRKTWDFRNGFSQKTINALKADQEEFGTDKYWRNFESDASKADEQHFWNASKEAKNADGYAATHGGGNEKVVEELEGLQLGFSAAKKFVITYNGATSPNEFESEGGPALGEPIPHGPSYIWLNGKNETIKFQAEVNQTIKIAVESHAVNRSKLGEARGISLSADAGTLTPKFSGNPVPTYYTEYEWDLTGDAGTVANLTIKSTSGCHIYYIIVGEGDDPNANKSKVAYLTAGDATAEEAWQALAGNDNMALTAIDLSTTTLTNDMLAQYDASVISPELPADNASVSTLKQAIAFYPILNLNPNLYAAWNYGEAIENEMSIGLIKNLKNDLLIGFLPGEDYEATDEGNIIELTQNNTYTGVKLGEYFADDDVVIDNGMEGDDKLAAVHTHNLFHNGYAYLPFKAASASAMKLLDNAISSLKSSKAEITKAPAPKITFDYKNMNTRVSMALASSSYKMVKIFYTTDGSLPTEASAAYTDTLIVTEPTTFKAIAIADGYLLSDVAEATAQIYTQPATPSLNIAYEEGQTKVDLNCATDSVVLWYNFSETNDTTKSMKYTEPIIVTAPTTLTAFAVAGGMVFSEPATKRITVKNPKVRIDQIALFDANATDWQMGGSGSTVYYFTWGKSSASIYDTTAEPIETKEDPVTGDQITVYPEKDYEYYMPTTTDGSEPTWEVKSKGQVMIWQSLTAGNDPGNDQGYNPETAGDILEHAKIINNDIQFGGKNSGERCTGAIQSRTTFAGPFDVITHIGTAAGGDNVGKMLIEVSTDSLNWTALGDTMKTSTVKRLWKSYTRSYEGTDNVYVRIVQAGGGSSVQIYDMYVMNEGEKSTAKKAEYMAEYDEQASGISEALQTRRPAIVGIYNLNGIRRNQLQRGLNIVVSADGKYKKVIIK